MIDYFALALTHGLLLIALLRLAERPDLDRADAAMPGVSGAEDKPLTKREEKRRRRERAGRGKGGAGEEGDSHA